MQRVADSDLDRDSRGQRLDQIGPIASLKVVAVDVHLRDRAGKRINQMARMITQHSYAGCAKHCAAPTGLLFVCGFTYHTRNGFDLFSCANYLGKVATILVVLRAW
jgi:hypothetical protein